MQSIKILISLFVWACVSTVPAQDASNGTIEEEQKKIVQEIRQSHIDGNLPSKEVFQEYLIRDIQKHFKLSVTNDFGLEIQFLRDGPTQTGLSFPKFYLWVSVKYANGRVQEGAMRIAAVNKTHFDITDFTPRREIVENPNVIEDVFPEALVSKIRSKAGLKD